MKNYLKKGYLGYYGKYINENKNVIVNKMNNLVDEYNRLINSFDTEFENENFHKSMIKKIERLHT